MRYTVEVYIFLWSHEKPQISNNDTIQTSNYLPEKASHIVYSYYYQHITSILQLIMRKYYQELLSGNIMRNACHLHFLYGHKNIYKWKKKHKWKDNGEIWWNHITYQTYPEARMNRQYSGNKHWHSWPNVFIPESLLV